MCTSNYSVVPGSMLGSMYSGSVYLLYFGKFNEALMIRQPRNGIACELRLSRKMITFPLKTPILRSL